MTHPKISPHHLMLQKLEPMPPGLSVVLFIKTALTLAYILFTHNTIEALISVLILESLILWVWSGQGSAL